MSKSKKKIPYAGKEKRKPRALRALGADVTKIPVPPPKQLQPVRHVLTGDGERAPIAPMTPEKRAEVETKIAEASKTVDPVKKSEELRAQQKLAKNERERARRAAKKEKQAAAAAGKTTSMPLSGKDALRAINNKTARSPGMARLQASGKAAEIAKAHADDVKKATTPKSSKPKKTSNRKPWFKEEDGKRAVQMMRRQNGASSSEMQTELKWSAYIVRRFVRDHVRSKSKLGLKTKMERGQNGETRYWIV